MAKAPAKRMTNASEQKKALQKRGIWRKQARQNAIILVADTKPEITNADALLGVDAQWDALNLLFDQSTDELDKREYVARINDLEREHTILSDKKLHQAWDAYKPSAHIGKAAEKLRAAAAEIEEKAATITKLASLLGAISKFISALE